MSRWIGLGVVITLLIVGWVAYDRPELFPGDLDVPGVIYLLMALLLVSGAAYGFHRFRLEPRRALIGLVFWAALIVVIVLGYNWLN